MLACIRRDESITNPVLLHRRPEALAFHMITYYKNDQSLVKIRERSRYRPFPEWRSRCPFCLKSPVEIFDGEQIQMERVKRLSFTWPFPLIIQLSADSNEHYPLSGVNRWKGVPRARDLWINQRNRFLRCRYIIIQNANFILFIFRVSFNCVKSLWYNSQNFQLSKIRNSHGTRIFIFM